MSDLVKYLRDCSTNEPYQDDADKLWAAADLISQQDAELERLRRELEEIRALLKDPAAVRINYLRGDIACQALIAEARKAAFIEAAEIASGVASRLVGPVKIGPAAAAAMEIAATLRGKAEETDR